jgi:NADPH:quinone reductase-like Zn-dependent oxidoreductase
MLRIIVALTSMLLTRASTMIGAGLQDATTPEAAQDVVKLIRLPVPTLRSKDVLVRQEASSLNHLDMLWDILLPSATFYTAEAFWKVQGAFPKILGMDVSGTVVAVGSEVTKYSVGDQVWGFNAAGAVWDGSTFGGLAGHAWAQFVRVSEGSIGLKPNKMNFTEAGSVPLCGLTALSALKAIGAPWKSGATVIVLGATGGVGSLAVQIAKALGATRLIATASGSKADFVRSLGADEVIDYHTEQWFNSSRIADKSVDAVLDTVLQPGTGDQAYGKLKDGGGFATLCTGIPSCGAPEPSLWKILGRPSLKHVALRCTSGGCATSDNLNELRNLVEADHLRAQVQEIFKLEDIQAALTRFKAGHITGKISLTMTGNEDIIV